MKKKSIFLIQTIFICFGLVFASNLVLDQEKAGKSEGKPTLVPDEIIVHFSKSATDAQKDNIKNKYGLSKKRESYKKGEFVVFKHKSPIAILEQLKNEPGVIYAEQNAFAYACSMVPDDPYFSPYQWNFTRIEMESAWELSTGSGAVVAVVDTGVKQSLDDLAGTNFMPGYDFVNDDNDPLDDNGHGSHLCGTIAQSTNNAIGTAGIAYTCTIIPVKVLDQDRVGTYSDVADGIYYAVDNGADVINLSLAGAESSTTLENAVYYAWNNGALLICAAGDDGSGSLFYPAAYDPCIAVSATNMLDQITDYSNYGSYIDICAPGGDDNDYNSDGYPDGILQNTIGPSGDGYYFYTGTSSAAAHVSGVAALVKACKPSLDNSGIRYNLEGTAVDLGDYGWDPYYGFGRVNASTAVQGACYMFRLLYVYDIGMNAYKQGKNYWATAVITILEIDGTPAPDAIVYVTWSGVVNGNQAGVTGADGKVTFTSPNALKTTGPFIITVDDVQHTLPYDPGFNIETTDSIYY